MESKKKVKKSRLIYISIVVVLLLLQVVAWNSRSFSDAYIAYIFPIWVNIYGRITGSFPFSVGEWMIVAGIAVVISAVLLGISMIFPGCRHSAKYCRGVKRYFRFFAWVLLFVFAIMTLNCTMIYHGSTFSEKYFGEEEGQQDVTLQERTEELLRIYNDIVSHCNALSMEMERDDSGAVVYSGGVDSKGNAVDMAGMYMCGYYFPFSMEANYNDVMSIMKKPATMCHELAHIRGYIYEDEANFIAFLACVESDDVAFQYSGYLSVLNYVANDLYKTRLADPESYAAAREAVRPLQVLQQVWEDNIFVTEAEWERINGKAVVDTETVDSVSDTLTDASLKLNGVSDGMISYNRVVELLLQWYGQQGEY